MRLDLERKEESIQKKKSSNTLFKHQILITSVFILAIVIVTISGSFAIFSKTASGDEYNVVQVGELELSYVDLSEEGNVLTLASAYPTTDEVGSSSTPYRFSVENTGTLRATYTVRIIQDTDTVNADGCQDKLIDAGYLRYKFDHGEPGTLNDIKDLHGEGYIAYTGTLEPFESNIHEIRLWINERSHNSVIGKHFHGKVVIEIVQATGNDAENRPVEEVRKVTDKLFLPENLGENCKTYNDGVDTFLVGQCSQNYVWYSGKLWRVVLKSNETGAVKMVTDNAITVIPYNLKDQSNFENSYADQWLNQEFLPTIHDWREYLVTGSLWDATLEDSESPTRPNGTTTIQRTVGLLNNYEYFTTYNNSDGLATVENAYLYNKASQSLITPFSSTETFFASSVDGQIHTDPSHYAGGIRPVVVLQPRIQVSEGVGTLDNPYQLAGDKQETINGTTLLNTRYNGEYIRFNNQLYRIIGFENDLTKITAVDTIPELSDKSFHSENNSTKFDDANIKNDLEKYYQENIDTPYKLMVAENQAWYFGRVSYLTAYDYKIGICKTHDVQISTSECERTDTMTLATIGLPRVGEMFTSQITRGEKKLFGRLLLMLKVLLLLMSLVVNHSLP